MSKTNSSVLANNAQSVVHIVIHVVSFPVSPCSVCTTRTNPHYYSSNNVCTSCTNEGYCHVYVCMQVQSRSADKSGWLYKTGPNNKGVRTYICAVEYVLWSMCCGVCTQV